MKKSILCFIILSTCWVLCGCGIKREANGRHAYLLNVERLEGPPKATTNDCLYLRPCRAANPYAGCHFIYRITPVVYEQDYYNLFLTPPDNQLFEILTQWFRKSSMFTCTSGSEFKLKTYTLSSRIDVLCVDFQKPESPKAVVQMYFELTEQDKVTNNPVTIYKKTYTSESPVPPTPSPVQITEAMSQSLTKILSELEADLAAVIE